MNGILFSFLNEKKLSPHMAQTSQNINTKNHTIHYHNHKIKMIVKLGINKGDNIENYSPQMYCLHNSLLMSIFDTLEKDLYHVEGNQWQGKCVHLR